MTARFIVADVFDGLAALEREGTQVDLVLTSPPFLALRSYLPADHPDKAKEIGSEPTPAAFLDTLLDVTEACASVLAPHGSLVFELGDTYSGSGGAGGDYAEDGLREGQEKFRQRTPRGWPAAKSLTFMPELYGASLSYGRNLLNPERTTDPWRIRNKIAWVRPNPPVGALGDKFRPAWSMLTVATKARDRWFDLDAVRVPVEHKPHTDNRGGHKRQGIPGRTGQVMNPVDENGHRIQSNPAGAPPLDWWKISPGGYSGSHYAVFPPELLSKPIEAMCPRRVCRTCGEPSRREVAADADYLERKAKGGVNRARADVLSAASMTATATYTTTGWTSCGCPGTDGIRLDGYHTGTGWRPGIVLDPFGGSGTTGVVAGGLSRDCILIDLDERNADLARERLGMFLDVETLPKEAA